MSTPPFGAASTPAFGAAGGAPAFGAFSSAATFGAASTPSLFGGTTSTGASSFGQTAPASGALSPFGGGVATPAFGAASSASLFGAGSTPGLSWGASSASVFGAASAASPFGTAGGTASPAFGLQSAAPPLFGAVQPGGGMVQPVTALATKDSRPITHSSKWEDLNPQTQQYLLDLERVVVQYREDCRQLDADPRLGSIGGACEQQEEMRAQAHSLNQAIATLASSVGTDVDEADALREAVLHLVRSTETALHAFKRAHAWREAAKASTPLPSQDVAAPPVLPSLFLREAAAGFLDRLRQHQAAVAELEQALVPRGSAGTGHDGLAALQAALSNVHDFLIHTAARLQAVDDRVCAAREAYLARRRAAGDPDDPFAAQERRHQQHSEQWPRNPGGHAAAPLAALQHPGTQSGLATGQLAHSAGLLQASGAPSPSGLFGTAQASPTGAFGTPLYGQQQRSTSTTSRKPGSRRR